MGFLRIREFGKGDMLLCPYCDKLYEVDYDETMDECPHCEEIREKEKKAGEKR